MNAEFNKGCNYEEATMLSEAILVLPRDILASCLALLQDTTLLNLLVGKMNEVSKQPDGDFQQRLSNATQKLSCLSQGELSIKLFTKINEVLDLTPRHYVAKRDFDDNAEEIIVKTLSVVRESNKFFRGNTLTELIQYQMVIMFSEFKKRFDEMTDEQQDKVMVSVEKFLAALPDAQRKKLCSELKTKELTDVYIRKMITNGSLGSAFAALVGIGGFSFYTIASSLLAGTAGLVGLTLPFGVYTTMASCIAVFSNPVFLVCTLGGGGFWLYNRKNKELQVRLIPMVIVQLVVAGQNQPDNVYGDISSQALTYWGKLWSLVEKARNDDDFASNLWNSALNDLKNTQWNISTLKLRINENSKMQKKIREDLVERLMRNPEEISNGLWGPAFLNAGRNFLDQYIELKKVESVPLGKGLFNKLINSVSKEYKKYSLKSDSKQAAGDIVDQAMEAWRRGNNHFPGQVVAILTSAESLEKEKNTMNVLMKELLNKEIQEKNKEASCKSKKDEAIKLKRATESLCWGLERL